MPRSNEVQNQKEIKEEGESFLSQPWRIFAFEAFLFSLTLALGITAGFKIGKISKIKEFSLPEISLWQFLLYFLLATLFFLLTSFFSKRFKKGKEILFKGIFMLVVFWGGVFLLSLWISDVLALFLIGILIFCWFKKPTIFIHNLCIVLGIAGIGSNLGLGIEPQIVAALLIILSVYDFIAVNITKHMVKMAKEMVEMGAILALILPPKIPDFRESIKTVKPGGKFLILGAGDIAFPLLFCVSLVPEGILNPLIVAFFALFGLFFSFWLFSSQKIRKAIPALPPIALFSIIGFLITRII